MRKITIWLNSGASIHSLVKVTGTIEEVTGFTEEEWDELSEEAKTTVAHDIAFNRADWGYSVE